MGVMEKLDIVVPTGPVVVHSVVQYWNTGTVGSCRHVLSAELLLKRIKRKKSDSCEMVFHFPRYL